MNTDAVHDKREYSSALRAQQASQTRERILEAFAEQMVDGGLKEFSINQVARRAEVSTRTVYHHFPTREDLLDGVAAWLDAKGNNEPIEEGIDSAEFLRRVTAGFSMFDEYETFVRATSLLHYLTSSEAWRSMKDESGMTSREAGEAVVWAISTLLQELKNEQQPGKSRKGQRQ